MREEKKKNEMTFNQDDKTNATCNALSLQAHDESKTKNQGAPSACSMLSPGPILFAAVANTVPQASATE